MISINSPDTVMGIRVGRWPEQLLESRITQRNSMHCPDDGTR